MVGGMKRLEIMGIENMERRRFMRCLMGSEEHSISRRRCAIGSLKEFSSLSSVNRRLSNKDYPFTSSYVGDKSILWCFDSVIEKEGFIRIRFFWDDYFTSMSNWSEKWIPKGKLALINVFGVPMNYWEESFFMKLEGKVGEPLWVEKEPLLDQG
ncbi:hypothetical protein LWI28_012558 [Acer negundo]|uniref:DUF4283 domain-containing protein n=1 Tax=Acer negundo TaxID=4023 RepID=A0AAD5J9U8_ACENE|nr:hypothetical protein LWI28_012558 [Acer negundo]